MFNFITHDIYGYGFAFIGFSAMFIGFVLKYIVGMLDKRKGTDIASMKGTTFLSPSWFTYWSLAIVFGVTAVGAFLGGNGLLDDATKQTLVIVTFFVMVAGIISVLVDIFKSWGKKGYDDEDADAKSEIEASVVKVADK